MYGIYCIEVFTTTEEIFVESPMLAQRLIAGHNVSPKLGIWISTNLVGGIMRFRNREPLSSILVDAGLHLLDSLRDRLPDNMDDIKGKVRDTYSTASNRVSRATNALRGEEESQLFGQAVALVVGVGLGIGIGVLIAPASGEETRADIADKVSDLGDKVHECSGKKPPSPTGTNG